MPGMSGPACCCGSGCNATICPQYCGKNFVGATVTVKTGGGATVASGTTGSGGCVTLSIGTAGAYNITVTATGFGTRTTSHALTCGGTLTYTAFLDAPTLSLTDSNGTIVMNNAGSLTWQGCYLQSEPATSTVNQGLGGGSCDIPPNVAAGSTAILYQLQCDNPAAGDWNLTQQWGACCAAPGIPVYISGALNVTTCLGGTYSSTATGTLSQSVISFPFSITLSATSFASCPTTLGPPAGTSITIDV